MATADAFMYMYSSVSGRRLAPPLSLDAPPHIFDMFKRNDRYLLLVVSRSAVVSLFDLEEQELVFTANAGSLLAKVTDGDEEEEGVPHDTNDRLRRGISVRQLLRTFGNELCTDCEADKVSWRLWSAGWERF